MRFLKLFSRFLRILLGKSEAARNDQLSHLHFQSLLTRILTSKRWIWKAGHKVKPDAFMPPEDLRFSAIHIDGLEDEKIWAIGKKQVCEPAKRNLHGRADISVASVESADAVKGIALKVFPDYDPPRHVTITGWPADKDAQMDIATQLAERATLKLPPAGSPPRS